MQPLIRAMPFDIEQSQMGDTVRFMARQGFEVYRPNVVAYTSLAEYEPTKQERCRWAKHAARKRRYLHAPRARKVRRG